MKGDAVMTKKPSMIESLNEQETIDYLRDYAEEQREHFSPPSRCLVTAAHIDHALDLVERAKTEREKIVAFIKARQEGWRHDNREIGQALEDVAWEIENGEYLKDERCDVGADYYAKVIVGVRVPSKKHHQEKRVKAFAHNHPEDWSVDPKSGKQLWTTDEVFLLDGVALDDDYDWRKGDRKGRKAVVTYDQRGDGRGENAFIGRHFEQIHIGEGDDKPASISGVDMLAEKKFLEDLLTPHGLWNEKNFGIWLIGTVSC